jgi:hypothetical protein
MNNGLVKFIDVGTEKLKRLEAPRVKPMVVIDNGSLVLTRADRHTGYMVSNKKTG